MTDTIDLMRVLVASLQSKADPKPVMHCIECGRPCKPSMRLCTRCYVNNKL